MEFYSKYEKLVYDILKELERASARDILYEIKKRHTRKQFTTVGIGQYLVRLQKKGLIKKGKRNIRLGNTFSQEWQIKI